ncbi:MAG: hypothetical protein ACKOFE_01415, partial [Bacteroidota bacterium]
QSKFRILGHHIVGEQGRVSTEAVLKIRRVREGNRLHDFVRPRQLPTVGNASETAVQAVQ